MHENIDKLILNKSHEMLLFRVCTYVMTYSIQECGDACVSYQLQNESSLTDNLYNLDYSILTYLLKTVMALNYSLFETACLNNFLTGS